MGGLPSIWMASPEDRAPRPRMDYFDPAVRAFVDFPGRDGLVFKLGRATDVEGYEEDERPFQNCHSAVRALAAELPHATVVWIVLLQGPPAAPIPHLTHRAVSGGELLLHLGCCFRTTRLPS